ncbi:MULTISPECIES: TetR/AcrR family transcriptional regulator [unclassified Streptomyces]|uniref:TetR/AcrR family transcriptional regulator n=1 Tax=unclassified Streptomyces TaxID=2593676 RepID=UPI0022571FDE|nr:MULTISPECIES: TetR/AcrR family transcriptional regulator [unclassified Streptomyces]MCX4988259.1 TetR/AcrR family transcriptional regulator [Streptomyces sp. NBC_00568]MCX5006536.1 TetR/AcrR family transcriptional regulator [Streptomyces sp. NBC_00638]
MGHREDLLEGAKRCLLEKGFVRTTARDIVKESGTNLASIGYHYGSKDALLTQAFVELIQEWGEKFAPASAREVEPGGSVERFHSVWARMLESFEDFRPLWAASMEIATQGDRVPELRDLMAKAQIEGRSGLVAMFTGQDEETLDDATVKSLGGFYQALLNGLMVQWLFDPASASTADELTDGLRRVIDGAREAK